MTTNGRTPAQRARQRSEHRDAGRYAKVHPCYRCGKSAGVNYYSFKADETDELGNDWNDRALCICRPCGTYLESLSLADAWADAWADATNKAYGKHPQGKPMLHAPHRVLDAAGALQKADPPSGVLPAEPNAQGYAQACNDFLACFNGNYGQAVNALDGLVVKAVAILAGVVVRK